MIRLTDIYVGDNFEIVEHYGQNTPEWQARHNLQGCPGLVWRMPSLTPILSAAAGYVLQIGIEEGGKGKYLVIQHEGFQTVYGHLNDIVVKEEERVIARQLIAHSNQSGYSGFDFPCLHFEIIPTDQSGNKLLDNGYGGTVNPEDFDQVEWDIQKPQEPAVQSEADEAMTLPAKEYSDMSSQATNYKVILSYLLKNDFNSWVKSIGRNPLNLEKNAGDNSGGETVVMYFKSLRSEFDRLERVVQKVYKKDEVKKNPTPKFSLKDFFNKIRLFK